MEKRSIVSPVVIFLLAVVLVLLAVLQYRWSGQVSEADRARMWANLNTSIIQFQEDLYSEMTEVCQAFQVEPRNGSDESDDEVNSYPQRYQNWLAAGHSHLVAQVFVWRTEERTASPLVRVDPVAMRLEPAAWPPELQELHNWLISRPHSNHRHALPPNGRLSPWLLEESVPALVHPIFQVLPERDVAALPTPHLAGYTIVELNMDFLRRELLPELVRSHFAGPGGPLYDVAIVRGEAGQTVYQSEPRGTEPVSSADVVVGLLRLRIERHHARSPGSEDGTVGQPPQLLPPEAAFESDRAGQQLMRRPLPLIVVPRNRPGEWQLAVWHHSGSLEATAATIRRRNLLMSFGVLLLLAVSMAMVLVSTARARRLATLQMEFVAGVSHELRTPLTVISAAADNLASGAVDVEQRGQEYARLIGGEARRLSSVVQQILLFASRKAGRPRYEIRPVEVEETIEHALEATAAIIQDAKFQVEKCIQPGLPPARADANALTQCIENLISNAVKYGGDHRWLGIRGQMKETARGPEIEVAVEDKGIGIDSEDLPHIFEPFYRGRGARSAQIHGTGLGLSLTKRTIEAIGGRLSVASTPGKGSSFVVHLAVAVESEVMPRATA